MKMKVRKILATFALFIALAVNAGAYLLTEDIPSLIQALQGYIRQGLQYATQVEQKVADQTTALNSVTAIERQLIALTRAGDPANLTNLPGVQQIALLQTLYADATRDIAAIDQFASPANITTNSQIILQKYGLQSFQGFTSGLGVTIGKPDVNFLLSNYSTGTLTQQTISTLIARKEQLTQSRDQAISAMQAATDAATVQKQEAIITALNGSIQNVDGSISQYYQSMSIQQGLNNTAQGINGANQAAAQSAAYQQSIEATIGTVNGDGSTTPPSYSSPISGTEFGYIDGSNNGYGGNNDPTPTGKWFLGDNNNYIGGTNSVGVAIPASVQKQIYGSTQAAFGQMVTLTNPQNGMVTQAPIVDQSPANKPLDMLYGTVQNLGLEHNSTSQVQVQFGQH